MTQNLAEVRAICWKLHKYVSAILIGRPRALTPKVQAIAMISDRSKPPPLDEEVVGLDPGFVSIKSVTMLAESKSSR